MSSLSIFVFDNADNFVIRRDLTSSELAAKSATFSLPKSLASTPCSFYAIANYDASSAKTRAALTALVEKSAADYNGTFAEMSTAAKRSVLQALAPDCQMPEDEFAMVDRLHAMTEVAIPAPLAGLKGNPVRFTCSTTPEGMPQHVLQTLGL